jgi:hypothetical protein
MRRLTSSLNGCILLDLHKFCTVFNLLVTFHALGKYSCFCSLPPHCISSGNEEFYLMRDSFIRTFMYVCLYVMYVGLCMYQTYSTHHSETAQIFINYFGSMFKNIHSVTD